MGPDKVLIDTNVCIDAATRRMPFAAPALEILSRSENGEFTGSELPVLSPQEFLEYINSIHNTKE